MKITVLTGQAGKVLATVRQPPEEPKGPVAKFGLRAIEPGHKLHEIELPSHMEKIESAEELHRALKDHLSKTSR
jgi:hypothetical protein